MKHVVAEASLIRDALVVSWVAPLSATERKGGLNEVFTRLREYK